MKFVLKRVLPVCVLLGAVGASAQFDRLKGATISVSATQVFTTPITSNPSDVSAQIATPTGGVLAETVTNQAQNSTSRPGVLAQFGFHPVSWAGVEVNYQFVQFDETRFFNYSGPPTQGEQIRIPVAFHEATASYEFHPKHIKFQPYVNVGGGAVDFLPYLANEQWRAAGLIEVGFDVPVKRYPHLGLRLQGRSLIYRGPNFNNPAISLRSWRSTEEPTAGLVYRF